MSVAMVSCGNDMSVNMVVANNCTTADATYQPA